MMSLILEAGVPRVSAIMAVYNAESWLAEAIESVLAQSFGDFEFLIHDDGSTDGSAAILAAYAQRDRRVIVSAAANLGPAAARNSLIEKARGDLIAMMDADDVCMPNRFERQVAYLYAHPDCVVLGGCYLVCDAEGRPINRCRVPVAHEVIDDQNLRGIVSIPNPTVMMRRDAVMRCGGYDASFLPAEDGELWLRMAEVGRLSNLPDIVLKYRIHNKSLSGTKQELQRDMCRRGCEAAWARRGLTGMRFDYEEWRMTDTAESHREFFLRYGWQAWSNGFRGTWKHYALQSVMLAPFSREAWTLLIAGMLRRPHRQREPNR
jgi:glycosyltransferase involved in cell wall biosynthesis